MSKKTLLEIIATEQRTDGIGITCVSAKQIPVS